MSAYKKIVMTVAAGLMGATLAFTPSAQAETAQEEAPAATAGFMVKAGESAGFTEPGARSYSNCPKDYICFYSKTNGSGSRCSWKSAYSPHFGTECSWMKNGTTAKSVYNNSGYRYHYYLDANYKNRLGSTNSGVRGNLAGSYTIGSLCRHGASNCPN